MSKRFAEFYQADVYTSYSDFGEWKDEPLELIAIGQLRDMIRMDFDQRKLTTKEDATVYSIRSKEPQGYVDYIFDHDILERLSCPEAKGYIVSLVPYRDGYKHFAYIGKWADCERHVWENDWLKDHGMLSKDLLLRELYAKSYGKVLITDWANPNYVAPILQKLNLGFATVCPLISGRQIIGFCVLGFPSWEEARKKKMITTLFRISQMVLVPLVLSLSQVMSEENLLRGVKQFFWPTAGRMRDNFNRIAARLQAIAGEEEIAGEGKDYEPLRKLQAELQKISREIACEGRRADEVIRLFNPEKPGASYKIELGRFEELVKRNVKAIAHDPGISFRSLIQEEWCHVLVIDEREFPMPEKMLESILLELLINAFKAVAGLIQKLWRDHPEKEELQMTDPKILAAYREKRGKEPQVIIRVYEQKGHDNIIEISDNGIGMAACVAERALDHGFSTHIGGSGLGLSIVRQNVEICGGRVELLSDPKCKNGWVTRVRLLFLVEGRKFPLKENRSFFD